MVWLWIGFVAVVMLLLTFDLCVLNRRAHVIGMREATGWAAFYMCLALLFNVGVYFIYRHNWMGIAQSVGRPTTGRQAAIQFLTGYLVEWSLSLDNIFVIAVIFAYFRVPGRFQHRVLFWGIVGAQVMRGVMIGAGTALINRFEWVTYVFGALLLATAVKMFRSQGEEIRPEHNPLLRLAKRIYPVTTSYEENRFFPRLAGRRAITPLCLVLLVIESTDVMFAVDSIPAIFAITRDPFIVFTSNIFAILGLRSMYFALASLMNRFRYIKLGLVFVLAYVGVKMLISKHVHIPAAVSLGVIAGVLIIAMVTSVLATRKEASGLPSTSGE